MNSVHYKINPAIKLQLDVYCTNLRFTYKSNIVDTFYEKVCDYFYKKDEFAKDDTTDILLHMICVANNSLERKLLKGFLSYLHSFVENPRY